MDPAESGGSAAWRGSMPQRQAVYDSAGWRVREEHVHPTCTRHVQISAFGGLARQKCEHEWTCICTCVEEIKRIARNPGGISMQGHSGNPCISCISLCRGVFQMVYILPERLLALVRPAFDLVLRRIPRATVVAPTWPVKNEPRRFRILTKQPQPPALFTVDAKNPKSCMENRGTQTDQPPPKKHPRITKARSAQA